MSTGPIMKAIDRYLDLVIIIFIAAITVSFMVGFQFATSGEHAEAIEAGAGAWVVDAKTGETRFVYGKGTAK